MGVMIPLSDGLPARRFPFVNVALIVANVVVWLVYEVPDLNRSVKHASFYPCTVSGACHGPLPWGLSWFTAMFMWETRLPRGRREKRRQGGVLSARRS